MAARSEDGDIISEIYHYWSGQQAPDLLCQAMMPNYHFAKILLEQIANYMALMTGRAGQRAFLEVTSFQAAQR